MLFMRASFTSGSVLWLVTTIVVWHQHNWIESWFEPFPLPGLMLMLIPWIQILTMLPMQPIANQLQYYWLWYENAKVVDCSGPRAVALKFVFETDPGQCYPDREDACAIPEANGACARVDISCLGWCGFCGVFTLPLPPVYSIWTVVLTKTA